MAKAHSTTQGIGHLVREWRRRRKLSITEVAHETGFSVSHLSEVERGNTALSIAALQAVCQVLNIDVVIRPLGLSGLDSQETEPLYLKPCPFCATGEPIVFRENANAGFGVACRYCDAHMGGMYSSAAEAVKQWNLRPER